MARKKDVMDKPPIKRSSVNKNFKTRSRNEGPTLITEHKRDGDPLPSSARITSNPANSPPRFIVNLSDPPEKRYTHIAPAFQDQVDTLPALYQEVLSTMLPPALAAIVDRISRPFLRRLFDREETREIKGISKDTGIPLYLLVAFNVLLDLFMGCTSGGVRVRDRQSSRNGSKMLHFRALDWGMDPLRKIVMEVEFVREVGGPVVARSVTYFGYVGVLTGVRPGMSLSLNFRPHHDGSKFWKHVQYGTHLLLVLFGLRRSISSELRRNLLPATGRALTIDELVPHLSNQKSTAAYLIFCDKDNAINLEKDNGSATMQRDSDFLVILNHDEVDEKKPFRLKQTTEAEPGTMAATGMMDLVSGSIERKECVMKRYTRAREWRSRNGIPEMPIEEEEVIGWMEGTGVVNDETHYAVVMDPGSGDIIWAQRWEVPMDFGNDEIWHGRRDQEASWRRKAYNRARRNAGGD